MKSKKLDITSNFPKKLKELREKREWSQGQLAKKINANLQLISRYERGIAFPATDMAIKMAKAFQVSLDYLLCDDVNQPEIKIQNQSLNELIEEVNNFSERDQETLINLLDAYVKRHRFEKLMERPA